MAKSAVISGGSEEGSSEMMKKRKKLTEAGYPELARSAKPYWDVDQAVKTKETLDNTGSTGHNSNGAYGPNGEEWHRKGSK